MNQEPEQQPAQSQTQPSSELPQVPFVADTPQTVGAPLDQTAQPAAEPAVIQLTPAEQVSPDQPASTSDVPLVSEPMGWPQTMQGSGLEWQASEYVEHEKSAKWFILLIVVALALAALAVFLLKNYTFAILIVVMAVAVAVWAKRPAAEMQYQLDASGVSVNGKRFAMHDFRAFGVLQDGGIYAVMLLPTKRFSPGVTIYFPHELGEQIVDTLGAALPMKDMQPDWIDTLTRKLNF